MHRPLEEKASKSALIAFLRRKSTLSLSLITIPSLICLALSVFPAGVSAHTSLLRADPANDAILRAPPSLVRLWFSTVVSPEFSTAVVEDAAHEYVNTHDASLSPVDAREMSVPLPPHLSPGVYTVVWRAVSDSDGLVVEGAYSFAIVRPGEMIPEQSKQSNGLFTGQFEGQLRAFLLALMPIILCFWALYLLRTRATANGRRSVHQKTGQGTAFSRRQANPPFPHVLNWKVILGIIILICFGLGILEKVPDNVADTKTSSTLIPSMQQAAKSALTTFHSAMRTTDKQFDVVFDMNTIGCCSSLFVVHVSDDSIGRQTPHMHVVLYTTMLDMHMGTDTVNVQPDGEGRFKSQIDLSMGGLWQVCIVIQATDHRSHVACVKVLIPY